jgi:hypothetical protein
LQRLKIIVLHLLLILYTIYDIDIHCDLVDPQMEAPHDQSFHRERLAGPPALHAGADWQRSADAFSLGAREVGSIARTGLAASRKRPRRGAAVFTERAGRAPF